MSADDTHGEFTLRGSADQRQRGGSRKRGGMSAQDAADIGHHGLSRAEAAASARRNAATSVSAMRTAGKTRVASDGVLTSQDDYEERRAEFNREVAMRGQASGRGLDVGGGFSEAADPALARARNPAMYPTPSHLRNASAGAEDGRGVGSTIMEGAVSGTRRREFGRMRGDAHAAAARTEGRAASRRTQVAGGRFLAPVLAWLGGAQRVKRILMVGFIMLLLNARRIYGVLTSDAADWDRALIGASKPRPAEPAQRPHHRPVETAVAATNAPQTASRAAASNRLPSVDAEPSSAADEKTGEL